MISIEKSAELVQRIKSIAHREGLAGAQCIGALIAWAAAEAEQLGMNREQFKHAFESIVATIAALDRKSTFADGSIPPADTPQQALANLHKAILFDAGIDLEAALATLATSGSDIKGQGLNGACVIVVGDLKGAESGREFWKREYEEACATIAKMHGAAVGKYGDGPKRGVVEDVEDLRAERDALAAQVRGVS